MLIAQISDPHIGQRPKSAAYLAQAVDHLLRLPVAPDVVLVSGDCADHGDPAEYALFRSLVAPLPMPVYAIPGNHDRREQMLGIFGPQGEHAMDNYVQYCVERWPVRLIGLDTHIPQQDAGELCGERLAWLKARLDEAPDRPTVLFMHHPPFPIGLDVCDQIGLGNADAFGQLIARAPQVEAILTGHLHIQIARRFHGTLAITCPAVDANLLPDMGQPSRLVVRRGQPACLLHHWGAATGLHTQASVIGDSGPMITLHNGERWGA